MSDIIKDQFELAKLMQGKKILHLNSLGKDSAVCMEWLACFEMFDLEPPKKVVALNYQFLSEHPSDKAYLTWQKNRYPDFEFIQEPNPHELTNIVEGVFQCPVMMLQLINNFEHTGFSMSKYNEDLLKKHDLDFISLGLARYESVSRASTFHKKGILRGNKIYPIGMMSKKDILNIIDKRKIKLHPSYKFAQSTYDNPSYYKMRSAFIVDPEYEKNVLRAYPLLALDKYRYEKLFKKP